MLSSFAWGHKASGKLYSIRVTKQVDELLRAIELDRLMRTLKWMNKQAKPALEEKVLRLVSTLPAQE